LKRNDDEDDESLQLAASDTFISIEEEQHEILHRHWPNGKVKCLANFTGPQNMCSRWFPHQANCCATEEHQNEKVVSWHTDGPNQLGFLDHKLWVMLERANHTREHSNLYVLPRDYKDTLCEVANSLEATHPEFRLPSAGDIELDRSQDRCDDGLNDTEDCPRLTPEAVRRWFMDQAACLVVLNPGDSLFFLSDVEHRTQDMMSSRVVEQFSVQ
jgi:hypothetical protein